jgi:hypothetical protein
MVVELDQSDEEKDAKCEELLLSKGFKRLKRVKGWAARAVSRFSSFYRVCFSQSARASLTIIHISYIVSLCCSNVFFYDEANANPNPTAFTLTLLFSCRICIRKARFATLLTIIHTFGLSLRCSNVFFYNEANANPNPEYLADDADDDE